MGFVTTLFKLMVLLALGAALAGVLVVAKKSKATGPVSFDHWPDVPQNPGA